MQGTIASLKKELVDTEKESGRAREVVQAEVATAVAAWAAGHAPSDRQSFIAKCSGYKRKVHRAVVDGMAANPSDWRTRCGAEFAEWRFTRHASEEGCERGLLCQVCFGLSGKKPRPPSSSSSDHQSASSDEPGFLQDVDSDY